MTPRPMTAASVDRRGDDRSGRLRGGQRICGQRTARDRQHSPQAAFVQDEDRGKGEEQPERGEQPELVLRCERPDEAVAAVERIVVIFAERQRIGEHEQDADQRAERQRPDADGAGGDQRTGDVRQKLQRGTRGDGRRGRPEHRQASKQRESDDPVELRVVAERLAIVDEQ